MPLHPPRGLTINQTCSTPYDSPQYARSQASPLGILLSSRKGGKSLGIPSSVHFQRLGEAPQLAHRALVSLTAGMVLLLPRSWDDLNFDIGHPPAFRSTSRVRHRALFTCCMGHEGGKAPTQ